MIRLVLVPINVHMPPNMAAYDKGIKNLEGDKSMRSVQLFKAGISKATTGVLLIKAEIPDTGKTMRANFRESAVWFFRPNK